KRGVDAVIAKVIAQLGRLEKFHRLPRLDQIGCGLIEIARRSGALEQQIHELKVHGADRIAERGGDGPVSYRQLGTNTLHRGARSTVSVDSLIRPPALAQQAAGLPLPAIERLRSVDLLSSEDRAVREVERLGVA